MKVQIRFHDLDSSSALRDHVQRRLHVALSRFGSEVASAVVNLSDTNGKRGGVDKRCRLTVAGRRIGVYAVEQDHADPYAAVELAVERAAHAVGRGMERARRRRIGARGASWTGRMAV